ncbi:hypothetical protein HK098_005996 [Nowakowskiella sp. JEL0407]|nr:hypothetical protein HK098_005996 [Nowakowskiella sp. JEL0407]
MAAKGSKITNLIQKWTSLTEIKSNKPRRPLTKGSSEPTGNLHQSPAPAQESAADRKDSGFSEVFQEKKLSLGQFADQLAYPIDELDAMAKQVPSVPKLEAKIKSSNLKGNTRKARNKKTPEILYSSPEKDSGIAQTWRSKTTMLEVLESTKTPQSKPMQSRTTPKKDGSLKELDVKLQACKYFFKAKDLPMSDYIKPRNHSFRQQFQSRKKMSSFRRPEVF